MLNLALTGNIASGKSTVAELFRRRGATIIDADQLVREVQRPGSPVLERIAARFGREMILPTGELDRSRLRGAVLGRAEELAALNAIVHPAVGLLRQARLAEARCQGVQIVINDIPLLFEVLDPTGFDAVILVDAPEPVRLQRLTQSRGLSREEAEALIRAQMPAEAKRARSDYIIDNGGELAELEGRVAEVWDRVSAEC